MNASTRNRIRGALVAGASFSALWLLLAGAGPTGWIVGVPAVVGAIACISLLPRHRAVSIRPGALLRLGAAFIRDSVRGAIDVGARAVARDPAIRAKMVNWKTELRSPAARLALANAVSLVPGTLTARVTDDGLLVHVLDDDPSVREGLASLEARIALALDSPPSSGR